MRKRKQYYISQFNFKDVQDSKGILTLDGSCRVEYPNSENLLFDLVYRLQDRKYNETIKNTVPEIFILKSKGINEKDEKEVELYEELVKNGVYVDGIKYVYSQKSASMIRTQKTVYVREDIQKKLEEYVTLGVKPERTVMAKWLSNKGLLMSTSYLMSDIPNIVVIEDFEKIVTDDVKMVTDYKLTAQDQIDNKDILEAKKIEDDRYKEYIEKKKELKEKHTQEYLGNNFIIFEDNRTPDDTFKSSYFWTLENRRVKAEELDKIIYASRSTKGVVYPLYCKDQTEEIKEFPVIKELLGYETKIVENNKNEINCFDGMGLVSIDYMKKIEKFLGIKNTNAIQGRLPFVKGLFVKFDFKNYLKNELNTYEIADLWGDKHSIDDIDILVTESCLKAKIELDEDGKSSWLFNDMQDYYNRLGKYGYNKFGIANYAPDKLNNYAPTTYQLINALNFTYEDLKELAEPEMKLIKNVIRWGDSASVKLFLDMISSIEYDDEEDEEDMKTKLDYIKDAIELNERMIFDKEVQKTLFTLAKSSIYEIMRGRIRIPGRYQYISGDIVGFCEWAAYRQADKVKGFLKADEFYCKGMENKEYIFARYPLTHYSEVKVAPFIQNNNKYIEHLHNIIQINMYDLTMPQLAGCDLDGDQVNVIMPDTKLAGGKTMLDTVIKDYVIVDPNDGALAKSDQINIDTIWDFEKANLHNLTGAVTNLNTTICDKAVIKNGKLTDEDLAISTCKSLQGKIIDSAKTGQVVEIPKLLRSNNPKLPYFFKYIYGGCDYEYLKPASPLSKNTYDLEKLLRSSQIFQFQDVGTESQEIGIEIEDKSYLDIRKIHELMIDDSKYDTDTYFDLHESLTPIHNDFSTARGEIYKASRDIDEFNRNEETKEQRKIISAMYAELYDDTKNRAEKACIDVLGSYNSSILASVATRIAYEDSKTGANGINENNNYLFGWIIAPEGLIENLKQHEDMNKTKLYKINKPQAFDYTSLIELEDNIYKIKNVIEESNIKVLESESLKINELKELEKYPATVGFLQKDKKEIADIFENKKVKIDIEKGEYISLFDEDEFLCSFTKNCIINKEHRVNLNKYCGQDVKVEIEKMNDNSIDIVLAS